MNPTTLELILIVFTVCIFLIVRRQGDIVRRLEKAEKEQQRINALTTKQLEELEKKTEWITSSIGAEIIMPAEVDDGVMGKKSVPFIFQGEPDPLPGLPRRYG